MEYSRVQFAHCIVSLLLAEEFEESFFGYVGSFIFWCILYEKSGMPVAQVGMSLAQIGEFAFILLSRASNLHLIQVLYTFVSSYVCATNEIHTVTSHFVNHHFLPFHVCLTTIMLSIACMFLKCQKMLHKAPIYM